MVKVVILGVRERSNVNMAGARQGEQLEKVEKARDRE